MKRNFTKLALETSRYCLPSIDITVSDFLDEPNELKRRKFSAVDSKVNQILELLLNNVPLGFSKPNIRSCPKIRFSTNTDGNAQISATLINPNLQYLSQTTSKLPMITFNVRKLKYTVSCLEYARQFICVDRILNRYIGDYNSKKHDESGETAKLITLALNFLIFTDLTIAEDSKIPDNQKFSNSLHRLRSTGYLEYIFRLAYLLRFDVDLIYLCCDGTTAATTSTATTTTTRGNYVYSYKWQGIAGEKSIGVLTAAFSNLASPSHQQHQNENEWFVNVKKRSIIPC